MPLIQANVGQFSCKRSDLSEFSDQTKNTTRWWAVLRGIWLGCLWAFPQIKEVIAKLSYTLYMPATHHFGFLLLNDYWEQGTLFKMISGPDWCGSVAWASFHKPRSCPFDSWSGHMPGLWARSLVEGVQEATNQCFSFTLTCLSLFLPSFPSP